MGGAAGLGGAIAALIARALLSRLPAAHAFRNTMLVFMGMDAIVWTTGWLLISERVPRHGTWRTLFTPDVRIVVEAQVEREGDGDDGEHGQPVALDKTEDFAEDIRDGSVVANASIKVLSRSSVFWLFVISVFVSTL